MNKDNILRLMEHVVEKTMINFKTDFYDHDKPQIASSNFKFPAIWIVGECHTHRLDLGNYKDRFCEDESVRYDYIRQHNPYEYFLTEGYYAKDNWFLITEDGVQLINRKQAEAVIMDYVASAVNVWVAENGPLPKLTKVPVTFQCITTSELKALIAECRKHDDDSLLNCLKMRHKSGRIAADQYTVITYHPACKEFVFCELVNKKARLQGHIVFHGWPETGYQANGAFQIYAQYGWSSHT